MSHLSVLLTELDEEGVTEDTLRDILYDVRMRKQHAAEEAHWFNLLENGTDEEIIAAGQEIARAPIVVLASTYKWADIHPRQELLRGVGLSVYSHPRRPVAMRGAKRCWVNSKSLSHCASANGAAIDVFRRYIRVAKLTCFTTKEYRELTDDIQVAIAQKMRGYGSITGVFYDYVSHRWAGVEEAPYLNGRQVEGLSASELANLKGMYAIIKKTDSLEERMEQMRVHREGRMAQ
jgi:hypothetical protein